MRYLLHQNYLLYHTFDDTAVNPRSRAFVSFGSRTEMFQADDVDDDRGTFCSKATMV